jgi:Zn-dependent protease with chaperone function
MLWLDDIKDFSKYIHPMEEATTQLLKKKLISEEYCNQLLELYKNFELENLLPDLIGKSMEVTSVQLPKLYSIVKYQSELLEISMPKLYVFEGRYCDVNAEGLDNPWIQISTKTLEDYEDDELEFAVARQMSHIKLGHMRYEVLCEQFSQSLGIASQLGSSLIAFVPGGTVASKEAFEVYAAHFKLSASQWSRVSEYTADRCAFVMCQGNITAAIAAIKKQILNSRLLADEMRLPEYLKQTNAILDLKTPIARFSILDEQFPYGPFRIKELLGFAGSVSTFL